MAGYAMAALIVAMSVMAILLSAAMPTWSQMIRRDKEEELIFRGQQYARAINQYQRRYANQSPASLDVLIEQRLLRKKFKDPLSPNKDGEFELLAVQNQSPPPGQGTGSRGMGPQGGGSLGGGSQGTGSGQRGTGPNAPTGGSSYGPRRNGTGAIVGVASKNTGQSIRTYNGKNRYSEWQFIGMEMSTQAGGGVGGAAGGRGGPDRGRGSPNDGRGGRGGSGTFGPPGGRPNIPPSQRGGRGF
jgi:type II secretory pathway pseudopilin PulG